MKFKISALLSSPRWRLTLAMVLLFGVGVRFFWGPTAGPTSPVLDAPQAKAALTVTLVSPDTEDWEQTLPANGSIVAWQEAVIAPEISNYRITEVLVQVGDVVKKGQVLARIASDTLASEVAEAKATVAELAASATEARSNAARATELKAKGFYSSQLDSQYQTQQQMTQARLAAAQARLQAAALKLSKTAVLAPDAGVIAASAATVGSLTQSGQELFRLIRGGRLEWRAELASVDLPGIRPGMLARLSGPGGDQVRGRVRTVAPQVNPQTRNGLVYVDLPSNSALRAGMFARGEFELGLRPALTVPQSAVVLREGFAYVFRLEGNARVAQTKVTLGRRLGERVEIVAGLPAEARIVETGAGFLADGDRVKVVAGRAKP